MAWYICELVLIWSWGGREAVVGVGWGWCAGTTVRGETGSDSKNAESDEWVIVEDDAGDDESLSE